MANLAAPLALRLRLDQITNNTVSDLSSNKRNGTIHGSPRILTHTQVGDCISLNGSTDYISVPDPFASPNSAFTISLWVQPNVINSGYHAIIGKAESLRKPGLWVGPGSGQLHYYSHDPSGTAFADLLNNFFLNTTDWVHIAWVKDGTQYRFYRNGTLFATKTAPAQLYVSPTTDYWIGAVDNYLNGQLANVRIYNQAVPIDTIQRDMEADQTAAAAAALEAYLKLDQITNNAVIDLSSNGRNGTIHGSPKIVAQTQMGACTSFNGSTDYIEITDPFSSPNTAFTISLWCSPISR